MIRFVITLFILLLQFSISFISTASQPAKIFYVAKGGNDSWSGNLSSQNSDRTDGPFATLEKARTAIRNLKVYGNLILPVTVQVRGGTYYLDKTFILESQDSGTKECPITYMAYPDEKVILNGGKRITGEWKTFNGQIMMCTIPEVKNDRWYFRSLIVNNKRQIRARIPNEGFYSVADVIKIKEKEKTSFKYSPGNLERWSNLADVEIIAFHSWDESRLRIAELDETNCMVSFTGPSNYAFDAYKGLWGISRYFIENVFEGLDSPGEWYLNRSTDELFYWPLPGENITDSEIIAPVLNQLLYLQGDVTNKKYIKYITFTGFVFSNTDWPLPPEGYAGGWGDLVKPSAIALECAEHCIIERNIIINVGTYGIEIGSNSKDNVINGNEISYPGSGGIRIGTSLTSNDAPARNKITNNYIHHGCSVYPSGIGICTNGSSENLVAHNRIHDIGYCGMGADGPANIFEYNEVYRVMQKLNDGGGIYMSGGKLTGSIVRNNFFHDIFPFRFYGWGIYLDESAENVTVMNNIVCRTLSGGSMLHIARNNLITNNILVNTKKGQIMWGSSSEFMGNRYTRNIVYYSDPEAVLIDASGRGVENTISEMDYNIYYYAGGTEPSIQGIPEVKTFSDWQKKMGFDFHSIVTDPLFVDPEHNNYTLKENSPAFKLGFQQIDISTVGPQE